MKVAYVLPTGTGADPHYAAGLANAVSKYAEVVVLKPTVTSGDEFFNRNLQVINAFKPVRLSFVDMYDIRRIMKMLSPNNMLNFLSYKNIDIIKKINPDIVHILDLFPQIQLFMHRIRSYPKVVTFQGPYRKVSIITTNPRSLFFSTLMSLWNILSSIFFKEEYDRIIVHTQIERILLIKAGFDAKKIEVIPSGTFDLFARIPRHDTERLRRKEERNTILFFGNIVWSKALDVLIEAIPMMVEEAPDIKLIIAGDGVIPSESWRIINKYRSNFEIHNYFIPNQKVGEFFSRASIVVIPNRRQEDHSASLTVAYSFGKPVVTTNVGEFPKLVRDSGCGLVIPPENPEALAEAVVRLLKDDALREKMKGNALRKAEELSWNNIAKIYMKVYEAVLDERKTRS
jgi:glycosyltransferase involved in cell wall biosynthesis